MAQRTGKGCLIASIVWMVILGVLALAAKYWLLPLSHQDLEAKTGSSSRFRHELRAAADSFSGYCILRSPKLATALAQQGIRLVVEDDKADVKGRIRKLRQGRLQLAVFTIDSFLTAGADLGEFPASIVLAIDESKGADALVAYKGAIDQLQDLNRPEARIVLTPDSPSEFLARTVIAHFNLPALSADWRVAAKGAEDVYRRFQGADHTAPTAYTLWEPFVSRALEEPGAHLLLDSSRFRGYILDVLVAERTFLRDTPDLARQLVEAYLRTAYDYGQADGGMRALVIEDAHSLGEQPLSQAQADKLVRGIEWKNTLENYATFGLLGAGETKGATHVEDAIDNILEVLLRTGALKTDPTGGRANTLFFDGVLRQLKESDFHPSRSLNVIQGIGPGTGDLETIRQGGTLRALDDAGWNALRMVGEMRIDPIEFARGTARLSLQGERTLAQLARTLEAWPHYYVKATGHARAQGDLQANLQLARDRAQAAVDYLIGLGVARERVKAIVAQPEGNEGASQAVAFVVGQLPY